MLEAKDELVTFQNDAGSGNRLYSKMGKVEGKLDHGLNIYYRGRLPKSATFLTSSLFSAFLRLLLVNLRFAFMRCQNKSIQFFFKARNIEICINIAKKKKKQSKIERASDSDRHVFRKVFWRWQIG